MSISPLSTLGLNQPTLQPLTAGIPAQTAAAALSPTPLAATPPSTLTAAPTLQSSQAMSMIASFMQSMIQVLCTLMGHNTGAAGTTAATGTTAAPPAAAPVPLSSPQQLQQAVQQLNAQTPGLSPQALAQQLNGRFSNTQFVAQPDGSLLYPLNGQNFKIAANGLTPPTAA